MKNQKFSVVFTVAIVMSWFGVCVSRVSAQVDTDQVIRKEINREQARIREKFRHIELMMRRVKEVYQKKGDQYHAQRIQQAFEFIRSQVLEKDFEEITEIISRKPIPKYDLIKKQAEISKKMNQVLLILEDRTQSEKVDEKIEAIKKIQKNLDTLSNEQKQVRKDLKAFQKELSEQAPEHVQQMRKELEQVIQKQNDILRSSKDPKWDLSESIKENLKKLKQLANEQKEKSKSHEKLSKEVEALKSMLKKIEDLMRAEKNNQGQSSEDSSQSENAKKDVQELLERQKALGDREILKAKSQELLDQITKEMKVPHAGPQKSNALEDSEKQRLDQLNRSSERMRDLGKKAQEMNSDPNSSDRDRKRMATRLEAMARRQKQMSSSLEKTKSEPTDAKTKAERQAQAERIAAAARELEQMAKMIKEKANRDSSSAKEMKERLNRGLRQLEEAKSIQNKRLQTIENDGQKNRSDQDTRIQALESKIRQEKGQNPLIDSEMDAIAKALKSLREAMQGDDQNQKAADIKKQQMKESLRKAVESASEALRSNDEKVQQKLAKAQKRLAQDAQELKKKFEGAAKSSKTEKDEAQKFAGAVQPMTHAQKAMEKSGNQMTNKLSSAQSQKKAQKMLEDALKALAGKQKENSSDKLKQDLMNRSKDAGQVANQMKGMKVDSSKEKRLEKAAQSLDKASSQLKKASDQLPNQKSASNGKRSEALANMEKAKEELKRLLDSKEDQLGRSGDRQHDRASQANELAQKLKNLAKTAATENRREGLDKSGDQVEEARKKMDRAADQSLAGEQNKSLGNQKKATEDLDKAIRQLSSLQKQIQDEQKELKDSMAKQQAELQKQAASLAKKMQEQSQQNSSSSQAMESAGKQSQSASQAMDSSQKQMKQGSMAQSRNKQEEALKALQKAQNELKQMRKEGLTEKERQKLERIRKKQKEMEKKARELAKKMDEAKKKKAAESTSNASKSMSNASQNMSMENTEKAEEDQDRAQKQLDQAKRELEKERNKYEQMRQDRVIFNLIHELRNVLEAQKKVRTQTTELENAKGKNGRLAGLQMRRLFKVAAGQKKLITEADKIRTVLSKEGSVVFSEQMEFASGDMEEISRRLKQVDLGEGTQQLQSSVETKLVSLIKALKDERQKRQKDDQQPPPSGEGGGSMKPQILPRIAELRALRDMEVELQGKTQGLKELYQRIEDSQLPESRKESMRDTLRKTIIQVGHRQGKIADLTRKFIEAIEGQR